MRHTTLASLVFALTATFGSTGCGGHRYYVRYARVPVRVAPPVYYAPPAPPAPPPPPAVMPPPPAYSGGSRPIVVYANAPGTTIVVVNPGPGGPPVVQYAGGAPAPQPAQAPRPEANPNAWFEDE